MLKKLAVVAVVPFALLASASTAQASNESFVDYIHEHGINIGTLAMNPSQLPVVGQEACTRLRSGKSAGQVASEIPGLFGDGPGIVSAAQRELCPDTL